MSNKIYISGQITGLDYKKVERNFLFSIDEIKMRDFSNSEIINPLDIKPLFGIKKWFFFMVSDLIALRRCTHIAMQSNWIESRGACIEHYYAKFILKLEVIYL